MNAIKVTVEWMPAATTHFFLSVPKWPAERGAHEQGKSNYMHRYFLGAVPALRALHYDLR